MPGGELNSSITNWYEMDYYASSTHHLLHISLNKHVEILPPQVPSSLRYDVIGVWLIIQYLVIEKDFKFLEPENRGYKTDPQFNCHI